MHYKNPLYKLIACCTLGLLYCLPASAHVIVGELEKLSATCAALVYLKLGYEHILPLGLDHVFFILTLFLLNPRLKSVLWQATAFTVAHSVTLGLAMYHLISPPSRVVEPLIAATILFAAMQNIFSGKLKPSRVALVFVFGLIHGMGFAGALGQLGLPRNAYLLSLVMFNLGVELGQLTIILAAFFLLGKWFGDKPWYGRRIVIPLSSVIAVTAAWWTIQRLFF